MTHRLRLAAAVSAALPVAFASNLAVAQDAHYDTSTGYANRAGQLGCIDGGNYT